MDFTKYFATRLARLVTPQREDPEHAAGGQLGGRIRLAG